MVSGNGNERQREEESVARRREAEVDIRRAVTEERWQLLRHIDAALRIPMAVLAFAWLVLLVIEFTYGLGPRLQLLTYAIWALFVLDFLLELVIAPGRVEYLRGHWLTAVSLVLPALRALRVFRAFALLRAARFARSTSLLRLLTSLNRGMRVLGQTLGRRGLPFVLALTVVVTLVGAAGMAFFESPAALTAEAARRSRTPASSASGTTATRSGGPRWRSPRWVRSTGRDRRRAASSAGCSRSTRSRSSATSRRRSRASSSARTGRRTDRSTKGAWRTSWKLSAGKSSPFAERSNPAARVVGDRRRRSRPSTPSRWDDACGG